jgi:2-iminobutanoate/2-iminopropanoate deaminase
MRTLVTSLPRRDKKCFQASLQAGISQPASHPCSLEQASRDYAPTSEQGGVQKLDCDGKPSTGTGFITPLIVHGGVIYIAGQGAHSHDKGESFPKDIENHTRHVMESVKTLVEAGGGTMDCILQLTVFLASIDYYDGMNQVFKTYFLHGGPARTTVAVAALPGDSLVEINCTAAVVNTGKKGA